MINRLTSIRSRSSAALLAATLALAACGGEPATDASERDAAAPTRTESAAATDDARATGPIDEATFRRRIATLSSDDFEGRAPGTPGGAKTRAFLIAEMEAIGLEPATAAGYEQVVPLVEITADPAQSSLTIGGETLAYGSESVFWTKRVEQTVSFADSDVVFVGYGVVAPEYGWNDYEGVDVAGKTVVMLINDPGFATGDPELFNGKAMTYYGRWTYKYEEAARQGATAAIIVHQTAPAAYGWGVVEGGWTGPQLDLEREDGGASRVAMEAWIQEENAKALFAKAGLDFDAAAEAAKSRDFKATPLSGVTAAGALTNAIRRSESANVAGVLRGSTAPDEYVLFMAHWDHLGASDDGGFYNGAVDNATGTAGILSIAEAFAARDEKPRRSLLFVAVTAEESGLLGSAYLGEDPIVPHRDVVGGFNLDAVLNAPAAKDVIVIGYGASELEEVLDRNAKARGLYLRPDAEPEKGFFYRSDHISLAKKGVPMLYADLGIDYVDGGEEAGRAFAEDYTANRYHKPTDEYADDWDMTGILQITSLIFDASADLADGDAEPNWYEGNEFRAIRDASKAGE